jgi:hypothetical protein
MPATPSQASTPAPDRKPMTIATRTTSTSEIRLAISDVTTCPQSTAERAIGMDWKRSKIPLETSVYRRSAVYATPEATVIRRMPGRR